MGANIDPTFYFYLGQGYNRRKLIFMNITDWWDTSTTHYWREILFESGFLAMIWDQLLEITTWLYNRIIYLGIKLLTKFTEE